VEQKYDGEYCQIHVCLKGSSPQIQIFSKSGRDSTADRANVYGAIVAGLAIGTSQCNFQSTCIMEGELLVWNDSRKQIEPFHKIRKHVRRAGRRLGCARDSPVQEGEHLMVVLYDLLLLDDNICVREPHDRRRQRLRLIVRCIPGRLDIGTRTKIDLGSRGAAHRLRRLFAATIARGGEGLVLKGCADPYLCLDDSSRQIKLKKDYIAGLGDTVDFVVVGGRRDARDEAELRMGKLSWTSFYAACLENKDQVRRFDTKPIFRIVARIDQHGVSKSIIRHLNQHGNFCRVPFAHFRNEMEVIIDQKQLRKPTELFKKPFVVELMGAGFDRPADTNYWTLRFPRIQKVHEDRTSKDVVSFVELQELAHECQHLAPENADEAEKVWLARLQSSDQEAQHAGSTESQKTSESSERNESEASLDETRPVENQTRTIRLEVADSQSDSTASSDVVSFKKRIRTESRSEISPPRKRVKRIDPTSQNSANETRMSVASPTGYPTAAAKPCEANTNPPFGQSRIGEAAQESDSTPASQIPRSNLHPQTVRFSADALAFLSKLRTPLLIRDSSRDLFSTLCRSQFDMYQELAISFTFCKRLFIESVLAPRIREASAKGNEPCWHVVVVRLDGHHSFFAEIRTLVAKVEEQHNAAAGDFHILFVDGSLFELLARDESRHWQGAIRGYLRYAAGKVVEITYGVRFSADFLQGIR
jgi:ATP-dependent DNA ligase